MFNVNASAPRHLRSYLIRSLSDNTRCLHLLSPKQAGGKLWRFAILYRSGPGITVNDYTYVIIGKGVATRDVGRQQGMARYGYKAHEVRGLAIKVAKQPKADRLSRLLAG